MVSSWGPGPGLAGRDWRAEPEPEPETEPEQPRAAGPGEREGSRRVNNERERWR